jgi:hypothetical protein
MTDLVMFYRVDQGFSGTLLNTKMTDHPDLSYVLVRDADIGKLIVYRVLKNNLIYLRKEPK